MKSARYMLIPAALLLLTVSAEAQKKVDVAFEKIREQCRDVPREKRLTVTVARFNVTTPNTGGEFGDNMATMLSNALQQVNCYTVLSRLHDKSDLNDEIDYGESKYASKKAAVKKGNQLGAQIVVTGEVTEFNRNTSSVGVAMVKTQKETVKLGFIIQLKNPETREIIASKSINVEGKSGGSTQVGIGVPLFGRINAGSGSTNSPAVANALEQGIIKAVEAIAAMKEEYNIVPLGNAPGGNSTTITVTHISYEALAELDNILKKTTGVKSTDPNLDDGTAEIAVQHEGSTRDLLEALKQKTGARYKVTGLKDGEIKIQAN